MMLDVPQEAVFTQVRFVRHVTSPPRENMGASIICHTSPPALLVNHDPEVNKSEYRSNSVASGGLFGSRSVLSFQSSEKEMKSNIRRIRGFSSECCAFSKTPYHVSSEKNTSLIWPIAISP